MKNIKQNKKRKNMENTQQNIFLDIETVYSWHISDETKKEYQLVIALIYKKFNALSYDKKLNLFNEYEKIKHVIILALKFKGMLKIQRQARLEIALMEEIKNGKWFRGCYSSFTIKIN
jgi:hypothetical protein